MPNAIELQNLRKIFTFSVKNPRYSIWKNFFNPDRQEIVAVDSISLAVERGESVAFIGPNGAGKSTTIKMLAGILYPTSGTISVLGLNPQRERQRLSYNIGTVFGQRSQLVFNLPVRDSFRLFGKIYELSDRMIQQRQKELVALFAIEDIMDQPVRKLSLGQRMRAEIAVSLIHRPKIIFLDEPTIGLDIVAKRRLREVLKNLNRKFGTTIFLTSHDAGDIEALCARTIIINHGRAILDMETAVLQRKFLTQKRVRVDFSQPTKFTAIADTRLVHRDDNSVQFMVDTSKIALKDVLDELTTHYSIEDMDVEHPSLEEIISTIYGQQAR
ncbi:ABC transporter ATP-binding protein [Candidatus Uhrbacteria bacterium]|nr:ABC transporter ATP-binding protein [Candidatus Uhrbacteria bacterium]